jgi:tyrosine-protein phosphatase SIW14
VRPNTMTPRRYVAALFVVLSLSVPATTQARPADTHSNIAAVPTRIDNFGRVSPNYYRGAQPKGHDYTDLAALGVKALINLTSDDAQRDEKAMTESAGMRYFQIPMTTHEAPTSAKLAEFLSIVTDPANQPVYVHCVGGRHRTGVMTAVYRIAQDGWTADQAFKEMKQFKFGSDFLHPEFKAFVYGYHPALAEAVPSATAAAVAKPRG